MSSEDVNLVDYFRRRVARIMGYTLLCALASMIGLSAMGMIVLDFWVEDCHAYTTMVEQHMCFELNKTEHDYVQLMLKLWAGGAIGVGVSLALRGLIEIELRLKKAGPLPYLIRDSVVLLLAACYIAVLYVTVFVWIAFFL